MKPDVIYDFFYMGIKLILHTYGNCSTKDLQQVR